MAASVLHDLLQPSSIAIVGASDRPRPDFIGGLRALGFKGDVYAVNPRYTEVLGLKCYPNLLQVPGPVDYVISAIPAAAVPAMIDDCAKKGVKVAHLYSARFAETGRPQDAELEMEVLRRARKGGVRVIGPNCMGLYRPGLGIGWSGDFPRQSGPIAMASQSSYAAHDLILLGTPRGMRFSKVVGYGNALDFNECDFLEYFTEDPETKVILMYVEGVKDGRRFLSGLRRAAKIKPVIIVKGGKGEAGARAAASHTASLAGSMQPWRAAVAQAGAIFADGLDEMVDYGISFSFIESISGPNVGISGTGGGPGVLAADQCEEAGLRVAPLPDEIRQELKSRGTDIWDWVGNPVDMTILGGGLAPGELLHMMGRNRQFDVLISIISDPHNRDRIGPFEGEAYLDRQGLSEIKEKPLLVVVPDKSLDIAELDLWTTEFLCDIRTRLVAARVPVYPTVARAARCARAVIDFYRQKQET